MADVRLGFLTIELPTAGEAQCSIMEDLAERFGVASNNEALAVFRAAWQRAGRKGKLELDSEADSVLIHAGRDAIVEAALAIHELARQALAPDEVARARAAIKAHKRPPRYHWMIGDVFAVPLQDESFGFGQVLWEQTFAPGFKGRAPTVALLEHRAPSIDPDYLGEEGLLTVFLDEVVTSRTLAILHHGSEPLDTQRWRVIGNRPPASAPFSGPCGEPGKVGCVSGDRLEGLANRWFGLAPWNDAYKPDYWDFFLMPGVVRPRAARLR